tara:strand:- start:11830 stop:12585 length:756 start_codon:yes stop_codon:yes gene_type:complete
MLWWTYGKSRYADEFRKCATEDCKSLFPKFSDKLQCNSRIIYQERPEFSNYAGKNILLIGGGESTNSMDWDKFEDYDYVWSVNHFFLHPVLKEKKVDLVMMMGEPDLNRKEWIDYRNKFNPIVGFEIHDKWVNYKFDDYNNYFCMHTYVYNILGACVRMIEFACELGVSSIDYIGLDGVQAMVKGKHAFEPGKTTLPSMLQSGVNSDSIQIFSALYNTFWERMIEDFPDVSFKNLGGGEQYHEISMRNNSV